MDELKRGFWGYKKDSVYRYIVSMEEDASARVAEKEARLEKLEAESKQQIAERPSGRECVATEQPGGGFLHVNGGAEARGAYQSGEQAPGAAGSGGDCHVRSAQDKASGQLFGANTYVPGDRSGDAEGV